MSRRLGTLAVGAVLLIALAAVGSTLPVPYVALGPGPTYNTLGSIDGRQIITVTGREVNESTGNLSLTTVSVSDGLELLRAIQGWVDSEESVVPREEIYPPDQTDEEIDQANREDFLNSQNSAEAAALGELGFPLRVVVVEVPDGSPSDGLLRPGDAIEAVNGTVINDPDTLLGILEGLAPATDVTVKFTRGEASQSATVTTTQAQDRDGAALGVAISYERKAPFDVEIRVADVGGPSAGLMLTLGILDLVGDTDLVEGLFVAGTGTITADGEIGPIGGVRLKTIAAKDLGADAFLVPDQNCAEALDNAPEGLPLITVSTLEEALDALEDLREGREPRLC
ncbi:MAG: PDZ domain-containing protein [Geodermatophilaceae bacterium]|nr:PDZ domain-containing protein [Geodermatophilaceae bacterium]